MSCGNYESIKPPCANCGKKPGYMGFSGWSHSAMVCSHACGERLHKKIEGGMAKRPPNFGDYDDSERLTALRLRIKVLEGRLRPNVMYTPNDPST